MSPLSRLVVLLLLLAATTTVGAGAASAQGGGDQLGRAEGLIEEGRPAEAIEILDTLLAKQKKSAEGFLLRSTALFMTGELERGSADLDRALELDASLRQGWLNRAALELSQERYEQAVAAFERARELDPRALDNDLNLGAALLLLGRVPEATSHFERYVEATGASTEALLLIAKNYALAGYQALALDHLRRAIGADERTRLLARTDPAFDALATTREFLEILATDAYQPPAGAFAATQSYDVPYETAQGKLLGAVIDALRGQRLPFDPRIEVTDTWALIWSDLRIKVGVADDPARGSVSLSAPPGSFTPADWKRITEELFARIRYELAPKIPG
ncbi:MAG TPA: tetratricopeptide repeat protein [Thermoanaerobaculia bacterium]|nr:tetratricopeptide repeat protein [Thermoanaerobaculia bacterium]